jgi:hypothetical protein
MNCALRLVSLLPRARGAVLPPWMPHRWPCSKRKRTAREVRRSVQQRRQSLLVASIAGLLFVFLKTVPTALGEHGCSGTACSRTECTDDGDQGKLVTGLGRTRFGSLCGFRGRLLLVGRVSFTVCPSSSISVWTATVCPSFSSFSKATVSWPPRSTPLRVNVTACVPPALSGENATAEVTSLPSF